MTGSDRDKSGPLEPEGDARAGDDLVTFFRGLSEEARREYAALAERDRRFGEDAFAERLADAGTS